VLDITGTRASLSPSANVSHRGERVILPPHPEHCDLNRVRTYARKTGGRLAIDLFCGAGGLSHGLEQAGFNIVLGVDRDQIAIDTHAANFGGASVAADLSDKSTLDRIVDSLGKLKIELIAGGPPCQPFSRAGEYKIRSLVRNGSRPEVDERTELWQSFLYVVEKLKPRAVLIENVPEMARGRNAPVFKKIVLRLEDLGYRVHTRLLQAWQHGVPQHRNRLFIVGFRDPRPFNWPEPLDETPTVRDAIGDLPPVEGGDLSNPRFYDGPGTDFQRDARRRVDDLDLHKVYDHITRAVRPDDKEAFQYLQAGDRYTTLPDQLRRYRSDIFEDKYNRLDWNGLSRTITAHIAKDGYWYIHPQQHRTLTVRESARIQTFRDSFRFSGHRSSAFKQIGEAVPPALAAELGKMLLKTLRRRKTPEPVPRSTDVAKRLSLWLDEQTASGMAKSWRATGDPWLTSMGAVLDAGRDGGQIADWEGLRTIWSSAVSFLNNSHEGNSAITPAKLEILNQVAVRLSNGNGAGPESFEAMASIRAGLPTLVSSLSGMASEPYPAAPTLRVVSRLFGDDVFGKKSLGRNSRLFLNRATAADSDGRAYSALLEIGERLCKKDTLACGACPLRPVCVTANRHGLPSSLFHDQV